MARIVSHAKKQAQAATTHQVSLPSNVENDVVIVLATQDGAISSAFTINESFTIKQQDYYTSNGRTICAYKVAPSGGITTAPTITSSTSAEWVSTTIIVRGADTADIFEAISSATTDAVAYTYSIPTVTTSENDCLIITYTANVSGNRAIVPEPVNAANFHQVATHQTDDFGGASLSVDWAWQKTAGTTTAQVMYAENLVNFIGVTFAINDDGTGHIPAYVDPATQPSKLQEPFRNGWFQLNGGNVANMSGIIPTIHGKTTQNAVLASAFYEGYNPFNALIYFTVNTGSTGMGPLTYVPASTMDMTWGTGLFYFVTRHYGTSGALYVNNYASGGMSVIMYDNQADEEYITWKVSAIDAKRQTDWWLPVLIQVDDAQNSHHEKYLTPNMAAIEGIALAAESTTQTNLIAMAYYTLLNKLVIAGGTTTVPVDYTQFWGLLNHVPPGYAERLGQTAFLSYIPIVFGGGNEVHVGLTGTSIQFPKSFDATTLDMNVHVDVNKLGITLDGNTGDTIYITNCLLSGETKWHFIMASGLAGTYDMTGTTIDNAGTVTLRDISQDLSGVTFSACNTIALNGIDLDSCTITNSTADVAMDITSTTECAGLTNLSFIDNTAGHSIEITATGTYTFDNFQFSGGGAAASSTADVYNNSGGAVTINVTNGGSTPTIKNGTSASTTVQNAVTVTVTAVDTAGSPIQNARVLLEKVTGGADVLTGLTDASGIATVSYAYTADTPVTGWVRKSSASPYYKQASLAGSITSSGYAATVVLVSDE